MNIIISPHALGEPKLKQPFTADMIDIVDTFRRNGLIRKVPCSYMLGNQWVMHPSLYRELGKRLGQTLT